MNRSFIEIPSLYQKIEYRHIYPGTLFPYLYDLIKIKFNENIDELTKFCQKDNKNILIIVKICIIF